MPDFIKYPEYKLPNGSSEGPYMMTNYTFLLFLPQLILFKICHVDYIVCCHARCNDKKHRDYAVLR